MEIIDWKRNLKMLYSPPTHPVVVDVPAMNFLMVDGEGNPNESPAYELALQTLYGASYSIKFALKKAGRADYAVMPLEGLWWADDMDAFIAGNKDDWKWTMIIGQPDVVTHQDFEQAVVDLRKKKPELATDLLRFETYDEGRAAQMMHLGPYSAEGPNIQRLHEFIHASGYVRHGLHHEIYLGDPRRTAPDKLKTVLRQPMRLAPVSA